MDKRDRQLLESIMHQLIIITSRATEALNEELNRPGADSRSFYNFKSFFGHLAVCIDRTYQALEREAPDIYGN